MTKPAQEVWNLIVEQVFACMRDYFSDLVAACQLSAAQAALLRELGSPVSQRELARRLRCDPSNITALADALEVRGLVERRPDPTDRRIRALALTEDGKQAKAELERRLSKPMDSILSLSTTEQEQLCRLLTKAFRKEPTLQEQAS
jgi:DNA-binding MarR family transcriptional regulator